MVAASGGIRIIGSAAEAYATLPAIGLRERIDREKPRKVYDPNVILAEGVTTDATATDIAKLPMPGGRAFGFETGKASTRLVWAVRIQLTEVGNALAA